MGKEIDEDLAKSLEKLNDLKKQVGLKYDSGKPDYNLIPVDALEGIAKVFTYGAAKYAPGNWLIVTPKERYLSAAIRHIQEDRKGNKIDEESGLLHLDHAITSLIMLRELSLKK